jgi:hypothetical protein
MMETSLLRFLSLFSCFFFLHSSVPYMDARASRASPGYPEAIITGVRAPLSLNEISNESELRWNGSIVMLISMMMSSGGEGLSYVT